MFFKKNNIFGEKRPFIPQYFNKYKNVFRSLGKEGLKGFYKGNLFGIIYTNLQTFFKIKSSFEIENYLNTRNDGFSEWQSFSSILFVNTLIDILLQPIHQIQSRFILQDSRANFKLYFSLLDYIKKSNKKNLKTFFQGWQTNLPINIAFSISSTIPNNNKFALIFSSYFLTSILVYPFMTLQRRLECMDLKNNFGLKLRYNNMRNGFQVVFREEGLRGFYKGFVAHTIVKGISGIVFMIFSMMNPIY